MSAHHALAHADEGAVRARAAAAVVGAVAADAASLGLHWIYDTKAIAAAVSDGSDPAFHAPVSTWHKARKAGDTTMYGEALLVTAQSLAAKGRFSVPAFTNAFYGSFGPGGSYVGYIDHATRATIYNLMGQAKELEAALKPPAGFTDVPVKTFVFQKLRGVAEDATGDALLAAAEAGVRAAAPAVTAEGLAYVRGVAAKLDELYAKPVGSDDDQINVLAKVPALVARFAGHPGLLHAVTEATRCTANNDISITWSTWFARVLEAVVLGVPFHDAVTHNLPRLDQPYRATVEHALKMVAEGGDDYAAVVAKLGPQCALTASVPSALYLLARHGNTPDYATVVRENILAGGDNCGRAVVVGSIAAAIGAVGTANAATFGVPADWLAKLARKDEITHLASTIHVAVHSEVASDHVAVHKTPSTARMST